MCASNLSAKNTRLNFVGGVTFDSLVWSIWQQKDAETVGDGLDQGHLVTELQKKVPWCLASQTNIIQNSSVLRARACVRRVIGCYTRLDGRV